jgi:transcriptional regulator with XRE-family HTH domain
METFGDRLRKVRTSKSLTMQEFADNLGVKNRQSIGNYENNTDFPKQDFFIELNKIYKINLHWLLTGKGAEKEGEEYNANEFLVKENNELKYSLNRVINLVDELKSTKGKKKN